MQFFFLFSLSGSWKEEAMISNLLLLEPTKTQHLRIPPNTKDRKFCRDVRPETLVK
jgi:hypothetical protein